MKLYYGFFKACTKKGEVDTRLMAALLRGLKRSYPYLKSEGNSALDEQLDTLYKMVHLVNFSIATQALQLIYQVLGNRNEQTSDRFYQTLYRKLQDPEFGVSSSSSAFLNLVFKALVNDESSSRIRAFVKRLLQTCQYLNPNMICGILYLISEIIKEKPLLSDIFKLKPNMEDGDESDTECYPDFDIDDSGNIEKKEPIKTQPIDQEEKPLFKEPLTSWVHRIGDKEKKMYDPFQRNPIYCGAEHAIFWELEKIRSHFHPSVKLFASNLLDGKSIDYSGDPLLDFAFMRFLDRFVYKNPKKSSNKEDCKYPQFYFVFFINS